MWRTFQREFSKLYWQKQNLILPRVHRQRYFSRSTIHLLLLSSSASYSFFLSFLLMLDVDDDDNDDDWLTVCLLDCLTACLFPCPTSSCKSYKLYYVFLYSFWLTDKTSQVVRTQHFEWRVADIFLFFREFTNELLSPFRIIWKSNYHRLLVYWLGWNLFYQSINFWKYDNYYWVFISFSPSSFLGGGLVDDELTMVWGLSYYW